MVFFNSDFYDYITLLKKNKVEYVLVGGMAVNIHGYRRSTGDMDIFVNPTAENHKKLMKVHFDFGMDMGEMELLDNFLDTNKYDVFTFGVSPIQIDLMTACKGLPFYTAYENAIDYTIDDKLTVKVVHYRDLIVAKKAANRMRDKADIEELEKLKGKDNK
ncbi:MAG TPA: nucleotidyltransferase [Fulvivirga sp.]|nr:nucleotidyltransferase [Fulvivirga sp.]